MIHEAPTYQTATATTISAETQAEKEHIVFVLNVAWGIYDWGFTSAHCARVEHTPGLLIIKQPPSNEYRELIDFATITIGPKTGFQDLIQQLTICTDKQMPNLNGILGGKGCKVYKLVPDYGKILWRAEGENPKVN
jgi:hypothetical protein